MEFDYIIIGLGIAGMTAANYLGEKGFHVAVLTKCSEIYETNTFYAQGGIVYNGENDSPELIYKDIMKAGAGVSNPEAVEILSRESAPTVKKVLIDDFNIDFSKTDNGNLDLTEEGAHSRRRILHSADTTGKAIQLKALDKLKSQKNVHILMEYTAIDIITLDHHTNDKFRMYKKPTCLGIYALNNRRNNVEKITAKAVILATGGMGQIYLHTTNPVSATGDGFAMAARAGARLVNMEYTQFHPTTLYHPKADNFLISEAVRGEGAVITDKDGHAFMEKYHPLKDLAPRDIVTRAILNEMFESSEPYVYLDTSPIGKEKTKKRFPNIYQKCLHFGIDITNSPIPIVPAFHFSCGGILTSTDGKTNINRLFAVGEVACTGVHGANRLASTSLLEGVVFGKRIADFIYEHQEKYNQTDDAIVDDWIDTGIENVDPALIQQDWSHLRSIMWNYVGPARTKKRLRRAVIDLTNLNEDIEDFYRNIVVNRNVIELRNAAKTSLIVAKQALANRESRGTHYRIN